MASTYLSRTPSSAGNRKTFTFSCWFKRGKITSSYQRLFACYSDSNNRDEIYLHETDDTITIESVVSSSAIVNVKTNRKFRDTNGWYHFVYTADTTQSTASDRIKIYINGVQETSFSTATYPSQNADLNFNNNIIHYIGRSGYSSGSNSYFDGCMSHIHFSDGYAYAPTVFGSTDSTTGEWKINTSPSFTLGTNGFTILKDGNTVTDQSANSNNFTVAGGTLTPTVDNPSNCFATLNPLTRINASSSKSFNNANTTFEVTNNNWGEAMSTLAVSSGKYYVEFNIEKLESSNGYAQVGVMDYPLWGTTNNTYQYFLSNAASAGLGLDHRTGQSGVRSAASVVSSNVGDFSNGDKIGLAVDMDNKAMYVHLNGTYYQVGGVTGVPTSGASKTGALTIPAACTLVGIGCACYSTDARIAANYGNGYFRTTAVSSAQNPDDGKGIFEYDVPAGYTALSTGGLNQ